MPNIIEQAACQRSRARAVGVVRRALQLEPDERMLEQLPTPERWRTMARWERIQYLGYWMYAETKQAMLATGELVRGHDPMDTVGTRD